MHPDTVNIFRDTSKDLDTILEFERMIHNRYIDWDRFVQIEKKRSRSWSVAYFIIVNNLIETGHLTTLDENTHYTIACPNYSIILRGFDCIYTPRKIDGEPMEAVGRLHTSPVYFKSLTNTEEYLEARLKYAPKDIHCDPRIYERTMGKNLLIRDVTRKDYKEPELTNMDCSLI